MKTVLCFVLSAVVACSVAFPQQRTSDGSTESSGKLTPQPIKLDL